MSEERKAATLVELKSACAGAPSDFLLSQLEDEATVESAAKAWAKAELDAAKADAAKARAEADAAKADAAKARTEAETAKSKRGLQPLSDAADDDDDDTNAGDAVQEYEATVSRVMRERSFPTREAAASFVNKTMPALRERYQEASAAAWSAARAR